MQTVQIIRMCVYFKLTRLTHNSTQCLVQSIIISLHKNIIYSYTTPMHLRHPI
jgi:hypothetical protein